MKLLTSLLLVGVSIGLFFMYIKPAYTNISSIRGQITQYDDAIARATQVLATRDELTNRRKNFNPGDVERLKKLLPDSVDGLRLVMDVNGIALQYSQKGIAGVKISRPDSSGAGNAKVPAGTVGAVGEAAKGPLYQSVSLNFTVSLTYDQFLKFLKYLVRSLHLVDVTNLSITLKPEQQSSPSPIYDYSIALSTYVLK